VTISRFAVTAAMIYLLPFWLRVNTAVTYLLLAVIASPYSLLRRQRA